MFRNLPPYDKLGETGLGWAPKMPSHWGLRRGKSLFYRVRREPSPSDGVVTCFRDGVVTLRSRRRATGYTESLKEIGYQGIRRGDLVIHAMDAFAGAVGVSDSDGKGTPVYSVCVAQDEANPHYYAAIVREMARNSWILALSKGIRERSTDFRFETFGTQVLPVPPVGEQAAIVRYLAHANARIDKAIAAKRHLTALLAEQRHCQDDRDLNDATPVNRRSVRLKSLLHEVDERSIRGDENHLSMSQKFGLVPADRISRTLTAESMTGGRICQAGDIVLNRLKAHLGVFAVAPMAGVVSADYTVLRCHGDAVPEFLCQQLRSASVRPELRRRTKGIVEGFWRLYTEDLLSMRVYLPDVPAQERIVRDIRAREEEFRRATSTIFDEISLLKEFRTRLVTDVVTGQIDIRAIAATLPDAPESIDKTVSATDDDLEEPLSEVEE